MRKVFDTTMKCAAVILFVAALVSVIYGAIPVLGLVRGMASQLHGYPGGSDGAEALSSLFGGISRAIWPFFGAALFWRMDRIGLHRGEGAQ